ncbi:MAG: sensor domain-containing diguanylate cyclase [Nitrospiraceae bacterium]|nr:sensor domain-containing diguanylate cyclase [Nitrospiraceae bacterium]
MPTRKGKKSKATKASKEARKKRADASAAPRARRTARTSSPTSAERDYKALFQRKLTENHLFYEVGRIIASETEPFDLIKKIVTVINKEIPFEDATVYVVKKDMTGLEPFYYTGPLFRDAALDRLFLDNGAPGTIAATGEPVFLQDAALYEGFLHYPEEPGQSGSYLGIALKNESRVIGTMGFSNSRPRAFEVEDLDMIRTLAPLISAGFEKADLFKKTLELSRVDDLTGLLNYRVLMEKMSEEVRRKIRTEREFSFIMVDIDDFKRVNDRYGHLEGSRLISQMGPLLRSACRTDSTDICFRYGGEEFSILLTETTMAEAMAVAERIRRSVEEYPFSVKLNHPEEKITISLGVSSMTGEQQKSITELINEADIALYHSKASGKNRVTCYSEGCGMPAASDQDTHGKP